MSHRLQVLHWLQASCLLHSYLVAFLGRGVLLFTIGCKPNGATPNKLAFGTFEPTCDIVVLEPTCETSTGSQRVSDGAKRTARNTNVATTVAHTGAIGPRLRTQFAARMGSSSSNSP
mmetsp:Transcript_3210/g.8002  ORF Transcript_3210/g.8002 Transcript_3210/m.8002 type:complete len:117 (-) Transcript_3210:107-457(-)